MAESGRQPEVECKHDEPLLRPVMQVSLESPALLVAGTQDSGPRCAQFLDPRAQLGGEALVLERERGCAPNRAHQIALLLERVIVDDNGQWFAASLDRRRDPARTGLGQLDLVAV